MIKIDLEDWEEADLKGRIVERISNTIINREFKLYGDIPDEGCYTPYDKFKNYVANLVADRIFKYMMDNPEISKRINSAIEKAEKSIVATVKRTGGRANRVSDDLISRKRLKEAIHTDFAEHFTLYHDSDQTALIDMIMDDIDEVPTAFDKEKAIDQLKVLSSGIILNTNISDYYAEGYVRAAKDIIDIIEKGGLDE